jgi:hypothetical protein
MSGKPGSGGGNNGINGIDRNSVKKNLNLAIDIVNKCFNLNEAKCV